MMQYNSVRYVETQGTTLVAINNVDNFVPFEFFIWVVIVKNKRIMSGSDCGTMCRPVSGRPRAVATAN
jgi:hypothetical protein